MRRNQLYKWRDQVNAKGEVAFPGPVRRPREASEGSIVAERPAAEIARLKREVAELREERDILKKAAAYFARELP